MRVNWIVAVDADRSLRAHPPDELTPADWRAVGTLTLTGESRTDPLTGKIIQIGMREGTRYHLHYDRSIGACYVGGCGICRCYSKVSHV